jgi:tetrahydromethanopterin S-methyltransferase subunit G
MADTIEKRVNDLEFIIGHLPEDLDARFAGVDTKLAELRELILLQGTRNTKLEARLNDFARRVDARFGEIDARFDQIDRRFGEINARFADIDRRFGEVDRRFAEVNGKLDQILLRLPPRP